MCVSDFPGLGPASVLGSDSCCAPAVNQTADKPYYLFDGYAHLAAGLACGLAGLAAGMAIGIVGDAGVRCVAAPLVCFLSSGFCAGTLVGGRQVKDACWRCRVA